MQLAGVSEPLDLDSLDDNDPFQIDTQTAHPFQTRWTRR